MEDRRFDVIIIGAGAAGLMCAARAGRRGRTVLLIDHAGEPAGKVGVSGGGRCNFTNRFLGPENYLSQNPHFVRSALARFSAADFIALVERYGINYHEREQGRLFCNESSREIIEMLRAECAAGRVQWALPRKVEAVRRGDFGAERFEVKTSRERWRCQSLVVATGGLAMPAIGATPFGYRLAEQFELPLVEPRPGLVPLALPPDTLKRLQPLAGASLEVEASCAGGCFREAMLITHRGLSGPVVLQVSSYWQQQAYRPGKPASLSINLLPDGDIADWLLSLAHERAQLPNILARRLPRRFAHAWCQLHGWTGAMHRFSPAKLQTIAATLADWRIMPSGTQGYAKAEVTLGGVDTRALSSQTMEARTCPGLFFIGEVMDVTGQLGGYNLQWAWSSGHAAGRFV